MCSILKLQKRRNHKKFEITPPYSTVQNLLWQICVLIAHHRNWDADSQVAQIQKCSNVAKSAPGTMIPKMWRNDARAKA